MDGYAIRLSDLHRTDPIPVVGECLPGSPPPPLQADTAMRIFTGAVIPDDCEAIIKREDTEELPNAVRLLEIAKTATGGEHVRQAGENTRQGDKVLRAGTLLNAAQLATMANFGCTVADCYQNVRVAVITTGDEVKSVSETTLQPWQLRNSNGAALSAMLSGHAWIKLISNDHCRDDRQSLTDAFARQLTMADAVILTGGVSMGDYDYVPDVVRDAGGEIVFHGLPVRPGKPILGAATANGKLIVGLPGNPVSATIGCHRFVQPLLAKISGQSTWLRARPLVQLVSAGDKTIPLHWLRLVRLVDDGAGEPILSRGSGDLVSLGQSTGYVELPPGESGTGPWPYFSWD